MPNDFRYWYTLIEHARFAYDLVIWVDNFRKWDWRYKGSCKRLLEELENLGVSINAEKTKLIDLKRKSSFKFLGFELRNQRLRLIDGCPDPFELVDADENVIVVN